MFVAACVFCSAANTRIAHQEQGRAARARNHGTGTRNAALKLADERMRRKGTRLAGGGDRAQADNDNHSDTQHATVGTGAGRTGYLCS